MKSHETINDVKQQAWDMSDVPFAGAKSDFDAARSVEELRERVVDMTTAREGALAADFKSGIYLFHSATVEGIKGILESGEILNAGEIYERKRAAKRAEMMADGKSEEEIEKELKSVMIAYNSGQEGISWSVNGIDAMPGTRGRIAGFVAAPELVLGEDKLVIPSRPAPYELLQVSSGVDAQKMFEAKKQYELWGYREIALNERATVESGLIKYKMNLDYGDGPDEYGFYSSRLRKFGEGGGLPADELRKYFEITEDGHVKMDEDLHQQKFDEKYVPPAAVFTQVMIDQGKFNGSVLEGKNVVEILNAWREYPKLYFFMMGHARQESKWYADTYEAELDKAKKVGARVEDMYFVTSHKDLDGWLEVMKKADHFPRGILLYDDGKVVKENFASAERGDCDELSVEIGRVVNVDRKFWSERMGLDVENIVRAGTEGQVLKDSEVGHNTEVRVLSGELKIVKV